MAIINHVARMHPDQQRGEVHIFDAEEHQSNWATIRCPTVPEGVRLSPWFVTTIELITHGWKKHQIGVWQVWLSPTDRDLLQMRAPEEIAFSFPVHLGMSDRRQQEIRDYLREHLLG